MAGIIRGVITMLPAWILAQAVFDRTGDAMLAALALCLSWAVMLEGMKWAGRWRAS